MSSGNMEDRRKQSIKDRLRFLEEWDPDGYYEEKEHSRLRRQLKTMQTNASLKNDIANLKKDTVISVFHGTSLNDAINFVEKGISASKPIRRKYPHTDEGKKVSRGLFVTTDFKTATGFGEIVVKFKVLGKNLFSPAPRADKKWTIQQLFKRLYPNSFRPEVSYWMLNPKIEQQALFVGNVSPRAIEKVYLIAYNDKGEYVGGRLGKHQAAFSRSKFMEWVEETDVEKTSRFDDTRTKRKLETPLVEPSERIDIDEFEKRVLKKYPIHTHKEIRDIVFEIVHQGTIDEETHRLSDEFDIPYSVARRLVRQYRKIGRTQKLAARLKEVYYAE